MKDPGHDHKKPTIYQDISTYLFIKEKKAYPFSYTPKNPWIHHVMETKIRFVILNIW